MRIDVITIFPDYFAPLSLSLIGKARQRGLLDVRVHDLRRWAEGPHRGVDDSPYGGGPGMVMAPVPWGRALDEVAAPDPGGAPPTLVVPTPSGSRFDQATAERLAVADRLVVACGRYEGIDARVAQDAARRMPVLELSVGDYVLAGGEAAALVLVEAVTRLLPGVLGNAGSAPDDSFSDGVLEGPVYTRPPEWRGLAVPAVLLSGDHAAVARWRRETSQTRTRELRPDLCAGPRVDTPAAGPVPAGPVAEDSAGPAA